MRLDMGKTQMVLDGVRCVLMCDAEPRIRTLS